MCGGAMAMFCTVIISLFRSSEERLQFSKRRSVSSCSCLTLLSMLSARDGEPCMMGEWACMMGECTDPGEQQTAGIGEPACERTGEFAPTVDGECTGE